MTVAKRLLIHVAVGAAIVVAVVASLTYRMVYQAAEQQTIENLNIYVAERTRREEARFQTIYSNLEVVRGLFLKRDALPVFPDVETRWNKRFVLFPDGAWRSREEYFEPRTYSNLWVNKSAKLTPHYQSRILRAQEICEDVQPGWVDSFSSLYFIMPGPATMGFDPRIARWSWQTPGDYALAEEEWVKEASPERNPSRSFVWTGVFVDPPSGEPFVTVQLPVDKDGEQLATVAHDMHINELFNEITRSEFDGATHLIFRPDGRLIAHPTLRKKILESNGSLTCLSSGDPSLANLYKLASSHTDRHFSGLEPTSQSYFSATRIPAAEWYFVTLMPRSLVQEKAFRSAQWVLLSGGASLALLFVSFAGILRRQVTVPLAELRRATKAMSVGAPEDMAPIARQDELGDLAAEFREMVERVRSREGELRHLNLDLEKRVTERTEELAEALAHEKELGEMKSTFVSLVSHEFRTPLGVIMSATDVLKRYFDRLPQDKRERHLDMILGSTRNLANLMEEVLLLGRVEEGRLQFSPVALDFEKFCRSIADEVCSATAGSSPVHFHAYTPLDGAVSDESVLRHIMSNVLSNAVKYSPPGTPVSFTADRSGDQVVMVIRDQGIGIPEEDQSKLFISFSRGSNVGERPGTGLGLVVVRRCVQLHGGTINLSSTVGLGTTVTITLPVFNQSNSNSAPL